MTGIAGHRRKRRHHNVRSDVMGLPSPVHLHRRALAAGGWNLILGSLLLSHGYRWGVALYAVSALIFWAAYILGRGKFGSRRNDLS